MLTDVVDVAVVVVDVVVVVVIVVVCDVGYVDDGDCVIVVVNVCCTVLWLSLLLMSVLVLLVVGMR